MFAAAGAGGGVASGSGASDSGASGSGVSAALAAGPSQQDHLEAFMLMATEKDVLMHLDTDTVINRAAEKTALLTKLLI
ncbi:unnamed protein product [Merluccius merluccius]